MKERRGEERRREEKRGEGKEKRGGGERNGGGEGEKGGKEKRGEDSKGQEYLSTSKGEPEQFPFFALLWGISATLNNLVHEDVTTSMQTENKH